MSLTTVTTQYLRTNPQLAVEIGHRESIVLLQLDFWLDTGGVKKDGQTWIKMSVDQMRSRGLAFIPESSLYRILKQLEANHYIKTTAVYNHHPYDRTRWIALDYEGLSTLESLVCEGVMPTTHPTESVSDYYNEADNTGAENPISQNEKCNSRSENTNSHGENSYIENQKRDTKIDSAPLSEINLSDEGPPLQKNNLTNQWMQFCYELANVVKMDFQANRKAIFYTASKLYRRYTADDLWATYDYWQLEDWRGKQSGGFPTLKIMEELILRAVDWEKAGRPRDYNGNRYSKYGPQYDYNSIIES